MDETNVTLVRNFLISHPTTSLFGLSQELQISQEKIEPLIYTALEELGPQNYRLLFTVYANRVAIICSEQNVNDVEGFLNGKSKLYAIQRKTEELTNLYISEVLEKRKIISHFNKNGGLFLNDFSNICSYKQNVRELQAQHKLQFRPVPKFLKPKMPEITVKPDTIIDNFEEFEENITVGVKPEETKISFKKIEDFEIDDLDGIMDTEEILIKSLPLKRKSSNDYATPTSKIKKEELVVIDYDSSQEDKPVQDSKILNVKKIAIKKSSKPQGSFLNKSPIVPKIGGKLKQAGLAGFFNKS